MFLLSSPPVNLEIVPDPANSLMRYTPTVPVIPNRPVEIKFGMNGVDPAPDRVMDPPPVSNT